MEARYFNQWEFNQVISLVNTNPLECKRKFEDYLKKYPKDYSAYPYYASILISLGEFESAEKILDFVMNAHNKDSAYTKEKNKIKMLKHNIFLNKIRLLSYQEKYHDLYQLFLSNISNIKTMDMNNIFFYCKKKIGMIDPSLREGNSYLFRQIINYDESDFLDHIKKHLADFVKNVDNPNKNIFFPNFPIEQIFMEIKKHIPSNNCLMSGFLEDIYVFKYTSCGKDNNKTVDYFKVICFHNTNEFITMFPCAECENLPHIDLDYLISTNENQKVKRMSQIDKFNKKYKLN